MISYYITLTGIVIIGLGFAIFSIIDDRRAEKKRLLKK